MGNLFSSCCGKVEEEEVVINELDTNGYETIRDTMFDKSEHRKHLEHKRSLREAENAARIQKATETAEKLEKELEEALMNRPVVRPKND